MTVMMELFYSPVCPHCPKAKETLLEVLEKVDQKIHLDEVNVLSLEGLKRAEKYGVMAVPTIIVNMRHKIVGVPRESKLLKLINHEIVKEQMEGDRKRSLLI